MHEWIVKGPFLREKGHFCDGTHTTQVHVCNAHACVCMYACMHVWMLVYVHQWLKTCHICPTPTHPHLYSRHLHATQVCHIHYACVAYTYTHTYACAFMLTSVRLSITAVLTMRVYECVSGVLSFERLNTEVPDRMADRSARPWVRSKICVHVCVCMFVWMFTCVYFTWAVNTCIRPYVCVCVHVSMISIWDLYACKICMCTYRHMYVCMHVCMCVWHVCAYACMRCMSQYCACTQSTDRGSQPLNWSRIIWMRIWRIPFQPPPCPIMSLVVCAPCIPWTIIIPETYSTLEWHGQDITSSPMAACERIPESLPMLPSMASVRLTIPLELLPLSCRSSSLASFSAAETN